MDGNLMKTKTNMWYNELEVILLNFKIPISLVAMNGIDLTDSKLS